MKTLDWISIGQLALPYSEWLDPAKRQKHDVVYCPEFVSKNVYTVLYGFLLVMFALMTCVVGWWLTVSKDFWFDFVAFVFFLGGSLVFAYRIKQARKDFTDFENGTFSRGLYIGKAALLIYKGKFDLFVIPRDTVDEVEINFEPRAVAPGGGHYFATVFYHESDGSAFKLEINRDYHLMRPENADEGPLFHELLKAWFENTTINKSNADAKDS